MGEATTGDEDAVEMNSGGHGFHRYHNTTTSTYDFDRTASWKYDQLNNQIIVIVDDHGGTYTINFDVYSNGIQYIGGADGGFYEKQ